MATATDFLFPLTPDLQLIRDEAVTVQNVQQLFLTRPLEHVYYPTMGVGLEDYIFENGADVFVALQQPILEQIRKYVSEFQDVILDIKQVSNQLEVKVSGSILRYGIGGAEFVFEVL